jgi:hypothetical protein
VSETCAGCGHEEAEHHHVGHRGECFHFISQNVLCVCWEFESEPVPSTEETQL